jgi:hypothetical protein
VRCFSCHDLSRLSWVIWAREVSELHANRPRVPLSRSTITSGVWWECMKLAKTDSDSGASTQPSRASGLAPAVSHQRSNADQVEMECDVTHGT